MRSFPKQAVTTMSNVQSPRPLDHQIVAALNQNAQALMEAQVTIAALRSLIREQLKS